jgi:ABC-type methionine transport system ATPase subunit
MSDFVVELDHVTVMGDDGRLAIQNVSFYAESGHTIALVGHVGGGKTTVLRLLARLVNAIEGKVHVFGRELSQLSYEQIRDHHRSVGFWFESTGLWANQTIFENIALPLRYHEGDQMSDKTLRERVETLAEQLDIVEELPRASSQVNASVRKRTLAARALILEPKLLLCDEPQIGLTMKEARLVAKLIEKRQEAGMTVILADHDGYLDPYQAHRTYYFEDGKQLERPSLNPPPDRSSYLGLPPSSLGGSSVYGVKA